MIHHNGHHEHYGAQRRRRDSSVSGPFERARLLRGGSDPAGLAHLVMVDNPDFHPQGDFVLDHGQVTGRGPDSFTFAGIGVYRPQLLMGHQPGCFSVVPLLERAMARGQVSGEHHQGIWRDIGTPERLEQARKQL